MKNVLQMRKDNIMKQYIKYICLFLILGMSTEMWGAKTGTIEFGNSGTKINAASVSGSDSQGNTWKIVTEGTSSYTQFTGYSQVGKSTEPATSITFGVKLPRTVKITSFSAKFGGFNNTAGSVTLKVTNISTSTTTSVGTGSLSGTSDVTVSSSSEATGDSLTVTVTSIDKGVKCYYVSYTYTNAKAYYIVYDPQGGTCATEDDEEASANAGVELPDVTPSSGAASMGWGFYGWAEEAVDAPTTTAPTIVGKAGDTYYPEEDIMLYAVFAKGEYTKITSTTEINESGNYLIGGLDDLGDSDPSNDKMFFMTHETYIDNDDFENFYGVRVGNTAAETFSAADIHSNWHYKFEISSSYYYIKNIATSKYVDTDASETTIYTSSKVTSHKYTITFSGSSDGYCTILNNSSTNSYPYLVVWDDDLGFGANGSAWDKMLIYKETKTPTYCSKPATVKLVASPAAGGTVVFDSNSKAEMDFSTNDGLDDVGITATPNSGYEFVNWVSSDNAAASVDDDDDATTNVTAIESATITANFYKMSSVTLSLTGFTKTSGPAGTNAITSSVDAANIVWTFSLDDHYRTTPWTYSVTMGGETLTEGAGNDYTWNASTQTLTIPAAKDITGDIVITLSAEHMEYTKYAFSCAELTLTPKLVTEGPIFVTSSYAPTSKTVRSQDSILVHGSGLTPNAQVVFTAGSKFEVKSYKYDTIRVAANGTIDRYVYIFYTPTGSETADGLDYITGITASVGGAKPKQVSLTQDIYGRHLPADFVIAGKKDGKWYALSANFSDEQTPTPVEITVDDINNPSVAYTASSNIYNLYPQNSGSGGKLTTGGQTIKLGMKNKSSYPLFAFASPKNSLKGDDGAIVTNNIGSQYWWTLKQINTSITNPQDAKYNLISSNNSGTLSIKNSPFVWGTYASGVEELRLIPASSATPTEAEIVAWGKNEAIIEVDQPTIDATSVIGKLPGDIASSKITLIQTGTSKGTGTRYDYTVDFGDDVDFSANEGKMLTLEWYNGESLVAVSNVTVPRIVASNTTLNSSNFTNKSVWNTEVHVLPGDTLTIDASGYANKDVTIKELHVYPGAAVLINTDTLKVTNLVLRSGWSRIGEKSYGVGSLYIKPGTGYGSMKATNAYMDWYIDYDQYYPIAVPWSVTTANISYQNMTVATSAGLIVRHYDGERHAKGGDGNTNWKAYTWGGDMPATLTPGIGYAITARRPAGKAFSIIRMPLTIPSAAWTKDGEQGEVSSVHKDQVVATAWVKDEGETPDHAKGWNFIANPYMCTYQGAITHSEDAKYNIKFVNIPDVDFKEFDQVTTATAKLKPGSGFLIQTEETGTLTFGTTNRKASMPSYFAEVPQVLDQQAYILLNGNGAVDQMGLFISDIYTAEYEINADLEKLLSDGNTLRTYMRYGDLNMAYVAINAELAQEWIPVTVRVPASNQYTFSLHEASVVGEMEGIYLIDYESNTITNLIENNYSFVAAGGTVEGRFAINAIAGQHETPTDLDVIQGGGDLHSDQPFKFLYHDQKKIKVINK